MIAAKEPPRAFIVGSWTDVRQKDGSFIRYYGSGAVRRIPEWPA